MIAYYRTIPCLLFLQYSITSSITVAAIVIATITIIALGTTVYIITLLLLISVASSLGTIITEVVTVVIIADR